jgi:hypothetical protein
MPKAATPSKAATSAEISRATGVIPEAIQEEYATVSSDLAHWGIARSRAARSLSEAELVLETWLAKYIDAARKAAEAKGGRAPGVDGLKEAAKADPMYEELARAVIDAAEVKENAGAIVSAISAKKEMLVSLGADLRLDKEREAFIKDRQRRPA